MDYTQLSLQELSETIKTGKIKATAVIQFYLDQIEKNKHLNAVLEVFKDDALKQAKACDSLAADGSAAGKLFGVPILIKDNMNYKGHTLTCASSFLANYKAPYHATIIERLLAEGAIILGRTNMDEFAMGTSTENSAYGKCLNPLDNTRVPGGSSGGSAAAVAANLAPAALGTDTGGSVRQPSAYCGVVGLKPTYGLVSRYGIVAFASGIEQVGPITRTAEDNAYLLSVLARPDAKDETSVTAPVKTETAVKKIGIIKEVNEMMQDQKAAVNFNHFITTLKASYDVLEVSIPELKVAIPTYYIIAPAEAASNLGRFDGIKYTTRSNKNTILEDIYLNSRSEGFGSEVKRRILIGNFVLSSGYYDAYYQKAKKVQTLITQKLNQAFETCDIILMPTTLGEPFKIGEKADDPVALYLEDLFTVPANIAGVPALSVPYSKGENGLPLGLQILGKHFDESKLYQFAGFVEKQYQEGE